MRAALFFILKTIVILVLPFIFLIRGAVYMHEHLQAYPGMAILGGAVATIILLLFYFAIFYGRLTGKLGNRNAFKFKMLFALLLVGAYCVHALSFLSKNNAKTTEVQQEYRSLHPILRLSISTILFVDKDLILTDASRLPEDYRKMGLKTKKQSLHYKQKNGYAHAFDVRTKGHSGVRNFLLEWYFKLMGLNTLRHGGTGDHLHISLKSHDRPGAI